MRITKPDALGVLVAKGCDRGLLQNMIAAAKAAKQLPREQRPPVPNNFCRDVERAAVAIQSLYQTGGFEAELAYLHLESGKKLTDDKVRAIFRHWCLAPAHLMLLVRAVEGSRGPTRKKGVRPLITRIEIPRRLYYRAIVVLKDYVKQNTGRPHLRELADLLEGSDVNQIASELRRAERHCAEFIEIARFFEHAFPQNERTTAQSL